MMMHKAEKKYEVHKVINEDQAKQRQFRSILNKLTPQNFDKLFNQVKQLNIQNLDTLDGFISQIFDRAVTEPIFCEMYAKFCSHLACELPVFNENNEKISFKRLLINKCQKEFEKGEVRQEMRIQALGNIRLIGELYKVKILTARIMHECTRKLLRDYPNPNEIDVEGLCKLMSTIGAKIDHRSVKEYMDKYFDLMVKLSNNVELLSRVRFMLKDVIDLRKNKWRPRRKFDEPKKIRVEIFAQL